jgi:hypothetical protein
MKLLLCPHTVFKRFLPFIIICISFFISTTCIAQQISEYEAKSAFIIKVAGFIEWPEKLINQNPNFIICILGNDPIEKVLDNKIKNAGLKIKGKNVVLKKINTAKEAEGSNILFISSSEKYDLNKIIKTIKTHSILTIGDSEGFTENGVMINMFVDESLKFNVNKIAAEESGIYISSKLLAHAKKVIK